MSSGGRGQGSECRQGQGQVSRQEAGPEDRSEPYRCCLSAPDDTLREQADALPVLNEEADLPSHNTKRITNKMRMRCVSRSDCTHASLSSKSLGIVLNSRLELYKLRRNKAAYEVIVSKYIPEPSKLVVLHVSSVREWCRQEYASLASLFITKKWWSLPMARGAVRSADVS